MRRWLVGLGLLLTVFVLAGCGSGGEGDSSEVGDGDGGAGGGSSDGETSDGDDEETVDRDELSYLTLTGFGVSRIGVESGEETEIASVAELELGASPTLPRLHDDVLWAAFGPGRVAGIDPESGEVERDIKFDSDLVVTDFAFGANVLWVQVGYAWADAVLLGVDVDSGEILFTVEAPANTTIGGMAVGDGGVWFIGGDAELSTAVSRVDVESGSVSGTFDSGVVVKYLAVGASAVWAGGPQPSADGSKGDAVARIDPASGELLATIAIGHPSSSIASIIEYNGAIWVTDVIGPGGAGAQLHRIDPATNAITGTIDVGGSGYGSLNLIAGGGHIFAVNSIDRQTYVINAETVEGEGVLTGPSAPVAIR